MTNNQAPQTEPPTSGEREALNPAAVEALAAYQQADEDGVMVLVSRQAIEECLPYLARASHQAPQEVERCGGVKGDLKCTLPRGHTYGCWDKGPFKADAVPYYTRPQPPAAPQGGIKAARGIGEAIALGIDPSGPTYDAAPQEAASGEVTVSLSVERYNALLDAERLAPDADTDSPHRCLKDTGRRWRCHKRIGHPGVCSTHNDCGKEDERVCGRPPQHDGPCVNFDAATPDAGKVPPQGGFACRICGVDTPHYHGTEGEKKRCATCDNRSCGTDMCPPQGEQKEKP